jgi:hypothetical protein
MTMVAYEVAPKGGQWLVTCDGQPGMSYVSQEAAFEVAVAEASGALRTGHEIRIEVVGNAYQRAGDGSGPAAGAKLLSDASAMRTIKMSAQGTLPSHGGVAGSIPASPTIQSRQTDGVSRTVVVQTLEVEPIRGLEVALDHAASTAFQISGAVLCLTRSLSSLN